MMNSISDNCIQSFIHYGKVSKMHYKNVLVNLKKSFKYPLRIIQLVGLNSRAITIFLIELLEAPIDS